MMPERILADTRKILPDDAIITTDVGGKKGVGQQSNTRDRALEYSGHLFARRGCQPRRNLGRKRRIKLV